MERVPYTTGVGGRMIDLPHRGNLLVLKCRDCEREVQVSGREIVTRFTSALRAPVEEWAATLSCGACRSRWIMVYSLRDPGADGFQLSTQDDGRVIWARRLNTWLAEVGEDVWAYADVLHDSPAVVLEQAVPRQAKSPPPRTTTGQ